MTTLAEALAADENVSDILEGDENVPLPELTKDDNFVLLKVNTDTNSFDVTLYQVSPHEAVDALMGCLMAITNA